MKLPPSNAKVWMSCQGAAQMQHLHPLPKLKDDDKSDSRKQGIAFHNLAEKCFKTGECPSNFLGDVTDDGVLIDDEMVESVLDYLSIITPEAFVEDKVDLSWYNEGQYGYVDAHWLEDDGDTLCVIDAKYGHTYVDEFENEQLIIYAWGLYQQSGMPFHKFKLHIFQPRVFGAGGTLRTWEISFDELFKWQEIVVRKAEQARSDNIICTTGNYCGHCNARHACTAFQKQVYSGVGYVGDSVGLELEGVELSTEYKLLKQYERDLKARLTGLEQQVSYNFQNGVSMPGLELKSTAGRKKWAKGCIGEVETIAELYDVKATKPKELITPTQLIKKGVDLSVINDYIEVTPSGTKIAEINEKQLRKTFTLRK